MMTPDAPTHKAGWAVKRPPCAQPVPGVDAPGIGDLARWLWLVGGASLALRLWIASAFPVTGDEAFFYWWGVYPDWGYYDHPPMVGWLIALMRAALGDSLLAIRLPVVALPLAVGAAMAWGLAALPHLSRQRVAWALLLFWMAPLNWLNVLITTDTPLIFWSALSVAALMRAENRARPDRSAYALYALSGLFLGCAFLSKYFAVVLGLAFLVYFAVYFGASAAGFSGLKSDAPRWRGWTLLALLAVPGVAINVGWNISHGWPNVMFNLFNRHDHASFEWRKPLMYAGMLVYLMTPVAAWLGFKYRRQLAAASRRQPLLFWVVVLPVLFFGVVSFKKVIGLHWVLAFYPFFFALLASTLPRDKLRACATGMAVFTGLHLAVVAGLAMTSPQDWKNTSIYPGVIRSFETREILRQATQPGTVLMADAYTPASIYGFEMRQYVPVFGPGNFHARQDDLLVDFSVYQGQTLRIITSAAPDLGRYRPYFESVTVTPLTQSGVVFYAVEGRNFDFPAYREGVLNEVFRRYYQIPRWLPVTACPFCERLCGWVRCSP